MQNSSNVGRLVLFRPWIANRLLTNTKTQKTPPKDCYITHSSSKSSSHTDTDAVNQAQKNHL